MVRLAAVALAVCSAVASGAVSVDDGAAASTALVDVAASAASAEEANRTVLLFAYFRESSMSLHLAYPAMACDSWSSTAASRCCVHAAATGRQSETHSSTGRRRHRQQEETHQPFTSWQVQGTSVSQTGSIIGT